jgi:diacylglycerol kinase (ATP)
MTKSGEFVVIWNPAAGPATDAEEIRDRLEALPNVQVVATDSRDSAVDAVKKAANAGARRIIAAGGDGTVNAVVGTLYGLPGKRRPEMAVLPLGTGNDLARSLGMPLVPEDAVSICLEGQAHPLDVLVLDHDGCQTISANMITAGNTGKYTSILTDDMKRRWGPLCYLRGAVSVAFDLDRFDVRVKTDGEVLETPALNLFFANGRTSGGGMVVSPQAELDDGLVDVVVVCDGTAFDLANLTVDYLSAQHLTNDLVIHRRCQEVRVICSRRIPLSADGDALEAEEFRIRVAGAPLQAVRERGNE